jgi:hypothetical protein
LEDDVKEVAVVQKDQGAMEHVVTTLSEIAKMLKGQKAEEAEEQRPRGVRRAEAGSHGEQSRGAADEGERRQPQGWGRGGRSQWPAAGRGQGQWGSPPPGQRGQGQWGSPSQGQWGQGRGQSGSAPMGTLQGSAGKKECRCGDTCQRTDCRYSHPTRPAHGTGVRVCRFPRCTKDSCTFAHVSGQHVPTQRTTTQPVMGMHPSRVQAAGVTVPAAARGRGN